MCLKVSKGNIAYDTSLAKSKVPFASTIATFHGRSFKPDVVVLYKNFHMGCDAQIKKVVRYLRFCQPQSPHCRLKP